MGGDINIQENPARINAATDYDLLEMDLSLLDLINEKVANKYPAENTKKNKGVV